MVIEIKKETTEQEIQEALAKMKAVTKHKRSSAKHFGALKRGLDGVQYQQQMRNEWN